MAQSRSPSVGKARDESIQFWIRVRRRSEEALACGALVPLVTERHVVVDHGVPFLVHLLRRNSRQQAIGKTPDLGVRNPFLPYDENLFVAELSPTHIALLNKFKVLEHHLLVVTRRFEEQESLLSAADFEALGSCLAGTEGVGFYNSGPLAGASQRHRHLQVVPRPAGEGGPDPFPLLSRLEQLDLALEGAAAELLPFPHATASLDSGRLWQRPEEMVRLYRRLLREVGRLPLRPGSPPLPYNLLATHRCMLLVPRELGCWQGVSVNALGFAGSLLVPSRGALDAVAGAGPYEVLRRVVA